MKAARPGLIAGGLALAATFALRKSTSAQATDPAAVVTAFETALNASDLEAANAQFADDAVIQTPAGTVTGKDQIRAFLQELAAQNFQFQVIGGHHVAGETETHQAQITTNQTRQLGIGPLDATANVVVRGGKIASFTVTYAPESLAKLGAG